MLKILISLKNSDLAESLVALLSGHEPDLLGDLSLGESVKSNRYDVVILDGEIASIEAIKQYDQRLEIIFLSTHYTDELAAASIQSGASAYLAIPVDPTIFSKTVQSLDELFITKRETGKLEELLSSKYQFAGIIGKNPQMLSVFAFMRRVAPYFRVLTIMGETGTGKELFAKALHSLSPVNGGPFIVCHCGGLVESLVASEFFGHRKGAFTGADRDKKGLFEAARNGTIFLDEIGELPISFQPHLLRVLQDGEFRAVGSNDPLKTNCRIVAATNRDLRAEVKTGSFREDLYYRLTPLTLSLSPLRDRKEDIPLLFRFLLKAFTERTGKHINGLSLPAQAALMQHQWPGNIRELQSIIEEAAMVADDPFIRLENLPFYLRETSAQTPLAAGTGLDSLDLIIRNHIALVLAKCGGNKTVAARKLGLSRHALLRKLEKYSII
jgi:DNA-binding NtrC family response regulator